MSEELKQNEEQEAGAASACNDLLGDSPEGKEVIL